MSPLDRVRIATWILGIGDAILVPVVLAGVWLQVKDWLTTTDPTS